MPTTGMGSLSFKYLSCETWPHLARSTSIATGPYYMPPPPVLEFFGKGFNL